MCLDGGVACMCTSMYGVGEGANMHRLEVRFGSVVINTYLCTVKRQKRLRTVW